MFWLKDQENQKNHKKPVNIPAGEAEQLQEPNNPNPLPEQPPVPMANNQLNWSHFKSDFQENQKMQRHTC